MPADFTRRNADRLAWLSVTDELLSALRVLKSRDVNLATDANRTPTGPRDVLVSVPPALERAVGDRLGHARVRDLLARWSTPTTLRRAGRTRVRQVIAKRSPRRAGKVTDAVFEALPAQTLTLPAEETWGEVIVDLAGDLNRVHARPGRVGETDRRGVPATPSCHARQGQLSAR